MPTDMSTPPPARPSKSNVSFPGASNCDEHVTPYHGGSLGIGPLCPPLPAHHKVMIVIYPFCSGRLTTTYDQEPWTPGEPEDMCRQYCKPILRKLCKPADEAPLPGRTEQMELLRLAGPPSVHPPTPEVIAKRTGGKFGTTSSAPTKTFSQPSPPGKAAAAAMPPITLSVSELKGEIYRGCVEGRMVGCSLRLLLFSPSHAAATTPWSTWSLPMHQLRFFPHRQGFPCFLLAALPIHQLKSMLVERGLTVPSGVEKGELAAYILEKAGKVIINTVRRLILMCSNQAPNLSSCLLPSEPLATAHFVLRL